MKYSNHAAIIASTLALSGTAHSAVIIDDFSTDTSANYTGENSFGSGGSFSVSGGNLNIVAQRNNTYGVFHNTALLGVGEQLTATIPVGTNQFRLTISEGGTAGPLNGKPSSTNEGIRYFINGPTDFRVFDTTAGSETPIGTANEPGAAWSGDIDLVIRRMTSTTYEMGWDTGSGFTSTGYTATLGGDGTIATPTAMFIGAEAFGSTKTVSAFEITAIPEPSSYALLSLGGLALMLFRRR